MLLKCQEVGAMTLHSDSRKKKLTNVYIIVVTVLLAISLSANVYFGFEKKDREMNIISCDNQYSAQLLKTNNYYSVQIVAIEDNFTNERVAGCIDYTSCFKYSDRFGIDIFWSKKGYDLFVRSSDIGVICLHFDEKIKQWNDYWCSYDDKKGIGLYENGSEEIKYVIPKDNIPDTILNCFLKNKTR